MILFIEQIEIYIEICREKLELIFFFGYMKKTQFVL